MKKNNDVELTQENNELKSVLINNYDFLVGHNLQECETNDKIINYLQEIKRNSDELVFANIFNDTIKHSEWFDIPLSLSSGAIGYNLAYVLYRVLNDIKPKNILELGLGQSTKIITEYVKHFKKVNHDVVEHDKNWIDFFKKTTDMSKMEHIHLLECYKKKYKGVELNAYKGFKEEFKNKKYDLILIDGPIGGGVYSRMDILDIIPECLDESFIIIIDDCDREGEQVTIKLLEDKLKKNNIKFSCGYQYKGKTNVYTMTSTNLDFICHI